VGSAMRFFATLRMTRSEGLRMTRGGRCGERHEILRYAQNDRKGRAQNDEK